MKFYKAPMPKLGRKITTYVLAGIMVAGAIFPIYWAISLSFRPLTEYFRSPPILFSTHFTVQHYIDMVQYLNIWRPLFNSLLVSLTTTVLSLWFCLCAAYATVRFEFGGKRLFLAFALLTQMLPPVFLVIPLAQIMKSFGLVNSYLGLIGIYVGMTSLFSIWLMRSFIMSIPREIEESAMIDGCGTMRIILQIVFPNVIPGIVAVGVYIFLFAWAEFVFALTLLESEELRTFPLVLANLFGEFRIDWPIVMTTSVIYIAPVVLLFVFAEKHLVTGLTAGAVKG